MFTNILRFWQLYIYETHFRDIQIWDFIIVLGNYYYPVHYLLRHWSDFLSILVIISPREETRLWLNTMGTIWHCYQRESNHRPYPWPTSISVINYKCIWCYYLHSMLHASCILSAVLITLMADVLGRGHHATFCSTMRKEFPGLTLRVHPKKQWFLSLLPYYPFEDGVCMCAYAPYFPKSKMNPEFLINLQ